MPASHPEAVLVALLALAGTTLATAFGLLPERIDLTTLFAALRRRTRRRRAARRAATPPTR